MESTIDRRTTQPRNYFVVARRWPLALLCGLLLACSALAQEQGRPEPLPTPDEMSAEAPAAQKAPDPNEAVPPCVWPPCVPMDSMATLEPSSNMPSSSMV